MRSKEEEEVTQVTRFLNVIFMTQICIILFTACSYSITVVQTQGSTDDFTSSDDDTTDLSIPLSL